MLSLRIAKLIVAGVITLGAVASADAVNFVVNGDFESVDMPRSRQISTSALPSEQFLPGWVNGTASDGEAGYNFYVLPGTATIPHNDVTSIQTNDFGTLSIWGADNGGAASNTFTGYSPDGGNYLMADGDFRVAPISQQINGLIAGNTYYLRFIWAAGQQFGSEGLTTQSWDVSLGSQTQSTGTLTTPSHGFKDWRLAKMQFTATNSTEVLSFLAHGTPIGQPPFVFLDNVRLSDSVPEPASWVMMLVGFGGLGIMLRRKRRQKAAA